MHWAERYFLPVSVITILLCAVAFATLAPIYPDEVAYKIFLERYFMSGGFKQSMTPYCSEGFMVAPGLTLAPAAIFWSSLSALGNGWPSYRLVPLLGLFTVYAVLIAHNVKHGNRSFWPLLLIPTLGPALYGILLLRAEIIILAAAMLLFLLGGKMIKEKRLPWLYGLSLALLAVFSVAAYVHPKALYLVLVMVVAVVAAADTIGNRLHRALYIGVFLAGSAWIAHAAVQLHQLQFLSCKNVPTIETAMSAQSVSALDVFSHPERFKNNLKLIISEDSLQNTLQRMKFSTAYEVSHLPEKTRLSRLEKRTNKVIVATMFLWLAYVTYKLAACVLRPELTTDRKSVYLIAATAAALLAPFVLNITKHFYEVAFFVCSLMVIAALVWPLQPFAYVKKKPWLPWVSGIGLILLSALCTKLAYKNYTREIIAGYEGPSLSIHAKRHAIGNEIRKALAGAGVPDNAPLVMDDLTYEGVKHHPVVMPITYLMVGAAKKDPALVKDTLDQYQVRYGAVQCGFLQATLEQMMDIQVLTTIHYSQHPYKDHPTSGSVCVFRTGKT